MEMDQPARSFAPMITLYLVLSFFSIPHLIDDFLFDILAEFGISVHLTQFLAGFYPHLPRDFDSAGSGQKRRSDRSDGHGNLLGPGWDPETYPADHQTRTLLERLVLGSFDLWDDPVRDWISGSWILGIEKK